jgi:hypothetical protein
MDFADLEKSLQISQSGEISTRALKVFDDTLVAVGEDSIAVRTQQRHDSLFRSVSN